MKIRILPPARIDLIDGYWFYERTGIRTGRLLYQINFADIESLQIYAGIHAKHVGKNRMVVSKFPHSIFYLVEQSEIRIYAILDDRRDPDWISERLK